MFFDYFLCVSSERIRLRAKVYKYKIAAKIQKKNDICKPESKKVTENAKLCKTIWKTQNVQRIFAVDFFKKNARLQNKIIVAKCIANFAKD